MPYDIGEPFHHVFKLTDVAGPLVAPEQRQRAGRETPHILAEAAREFQQKMLGQKLNVRHPAAQRRQYESEDVEPIVEILAEGVLAHGFLKVLVRRGDDAHRHRTARLAADAGHLAVLEQAQERNLRVHRHLAELVEKNGPAVRKLEFPRLPGPARPGERPVLIAEKLALHEIPRQRSTVHRHKRARCPRARVMDRLREEFLARAAFAEDEHRGVAPRDGFGLLDDLHERGRIPKDAVKRVHGLRPGDACRESPHTPGLPEREHHAGLSGQGHGRKETGQRTGFQGELRFLIHDMGIAREDVVEHLRRPHELVDVFALLRGRKPEHGGGFAVHELHLAGTGHHDDPLVEQFDDGLLLLEQGAEAELFRNGVGRRPHHAEGVGVVLLAELAHVEHGDELVLAVENRRRRTAPTVPHGQVMLRADDLDGPALRHARPDAVGSPELFGGDHAGLGTGVGVAVPSAGFHMQADAFGGGKDHGPRSGNQRREQLLHNHAGGLEKIGIGGKDMPENGLIHLLAHRGFGIDPGKAAALPRAQDEIADHGGIHGQATEEKLLLGRNGLLPGVGLEIRIMGVRHGKAPASSP